MEIYEILDEVIDDMRGDFPDVSDVDIELEAIMCLRYDERVSEADWRQLAREHGIPT